MNIGELISFSLIWAGTHEGVQCFNALSRESVNDDYIILQLTS